MSSDLNSILLNFPAIPEASPKKQRTGSRGGAENAEEAPRNYSLILSAYPCLRVTLPTLRGILPHTRQDHSLNTALASCFQSLPFLGGAFVLRRSGAFVP